jgi:high-affinity iron transporter
MFQKILLVLCFVLASTTAQAALGDFEAFITDIEGRLDRTSQAYHDKQLEEAKSAVQSAYFEVFENLEGPIRINISAAKSYEMEATFGQIRRMIMDGKPVVEVDARIQWLKDEMRAVQPRIETGHSLSAQDAYDNQKIAAYWRDYYRLIDDLLAEAVTLYQQGKGSEARARIQRAQFDGFKNSEMEIGIRTQRLASLTQRINQGFSALMELANSPDEMTRFGYSVTSLLQDIEEQLEDLPIPAKASVNAMADDMTDDNGNADKNTDWPQVARAIDTAISKAIAQYEAGEAQPAIAAVQNAYFDLFEASGMENRMGARDATAKMRLEGYFTKMVGLIKAQRPLAELEEQAKSLSADLAQAALQLGGGNQTPWGLAVMSLIIILREGMEALLIVTAIVAYLIKNQHSDKLPLIRQSVIVALAASFVTAAAFYWMFRNAGAQRELLEGFTMIIAVVVLFAMSYWLISKAEAERWKEYLEGKISSSLSKGSLAGLWFASFLAVYREGAETVLFYQAMLADTHSAQGNLAVLGGFVLGSLILAGVYFVTRYSVLRLPLKPFFLFTGAFMYLMAFVFAGKSVMELIEGKLFQPTLWSWVSEIPLLGIHPYRETILPQVALVLAAAIALMVMKKRRPFLPQSTD